MKIVKEAIKILSIVICRAGSKGLRSKCLLPIKEKPVIEYSIQWIANQQNEGIKNDIVLSTDIKELKSLAQKYGVLYIDRPVHLANDTASVEEVIFHAITTINSDHDLILLLMGNIPIRHSELLWGPVDFLIKNSEFNSVITFQNVEKYNPAWMFPFAEDKLPESEFKASTRQQLPQLMIHDGHTILFRRKSFIQNYLRIQKIGKKFIYEHFGPLIKPWVHNKLITDIDTQNDYLVAKALIEADLLQ